MGAWRKFASLNVYPLLGDATSLRLPMDFDEREAHHHSSAVEVLARRLFRGLHQKNTLPPPPHPQDEPVLAEYFALIPMETKNSFTFLRLMLAMMVLFGHTYVIGGFGGDPILRWSVGQISFQELGVKGFFALSGFLLMHSLAVNPSLACAVPVNEKAALRLCLVEMEADGTKEKQR